MAKRRFRTEENPEGEATSPAASAEDRRRERKRLRAQRDAGHLRGKDRMSLGRRALLFGLPVAVILVIVAVLLLNSSPPPCLQLQPIPAQSGIPAFPPANTTNFGTTWCPSATSVLQTYPVLTIRINGNVVGLPSTIGRRTNYTSGGTPYTCDLPLSTNTPSAGGLTPNTIYIISPWAYIYTLGDFFQVWAQSASTANVNSSFPSQPITYTSTDLLGFTATAADSVQLWVDNGPSSAGPNLNLDTLTNSNSAYPACLVSVYGSSHSILLTYGPTTVRTALGSGLSSPQLQTGGGVPDEALLLYSSPAPHLGSIETELALLSYVNVHSMGWLALRAPA
ncbi:MAG: hypothetical protein ACYDFT_08045 [Thermoplasmata archaeon]